MKQKYTMIIESMKAIAINSNQLRRDLRGVKMSMRERWKLLDEDYAKPYDERIELYACDEAKAEIKAMREKYPDYSLTEYSDAF